MHRKATLRKGDKACPPDATVYDCPMSRKGLISIIEEYTNIQGPVMPIQELSERCEA